MLRKNVAGQFVYLAAVNATTGAALTGATISMRRSIDGTFAAGGATITEDTGLGFYKVALTQADTNGNDIGYFFTATNMVPICLTALTTAADPSDAAAYGLSRIDAAITSRMATYTQPTGFLAATFPATVASTTNITAGTITTVSTVTGLTASDVAAIKAKTDSLTYTVAGQVDANVQYVNDVQVQGTGASGNEWGPV